MDGGVRERSRNLNKLNVKISNVNVTGRLNKLNIKVINVNVDDELYTCPQGKTRGYAGGDTNSYEETS